MSAAQRDTRLGWALVANQFVLLGALGREAARSRHAPRPALIVGGLLGAVGALFAAPASITLRRALTAHPAPTEDAVLRTDGAFGVVRHPIYSGLLCVGLGVVVIARTRRAAILLGALVALFNAKSRFEERLLRDRFPEYEGYAARVPRFIPSLRGR